MKKINIEKTLMILISIAAYVVLCLFSPMEMPSGDKGTIMAVLCKYNKSELIGWRLLFRWYYTGFFSRYAMVRGSSSCNCIVVSDYFNERKILQ